MLGFVAMYMSIVHGVGCVCHIFIIMQLYCTAKIIERGGGHIIY